MHIRIHTDKEDDTVADTMTKALARERYETHARAMGLIFQAPSFS